MEKAYPKWLNQPISANMVELLHTLIEPMRADLGGVPLKIISGWRPPELNQAIGGATQSAHLFGLSVDIEARGELKRKILDWLRKRQRTVGDVGYVGIYTWGVHVGLPRWPGDKWRG